MARGSAGGGYDDASPAMKTSDAALLDVLAACLGAGAPLPEALSRLEVAGPEASRWVQRVRPFVRPGGSVESALFAARAIDASEHAFLASAVTPDAIAGVLHALVLRRRRRDVLRSAIFRGLLGPFAIAALTVILDPLPNLIGSGSYVGPVFRGLLVLGLMTALVVVGVPAMLRSPIYGPRALAICARFPGLDWLAARHAEADFVTMSAPFVARPEVGSAGLLATSALLAWSPLGQRVRAAALGGATAQGAALAAVAPHLSLATNLSIVSGTASGHLAARLTERGEEIAAELTKSLRVAVRVAAYTLVVLLSLGSLASMLSRALPGASLPGATLTEEQKELDEIMRELEGHPPTPPPPKK